MGLNGTGLTKTLALTPAELAQVCSILSAHLPAGVRVSVFGSRAGGTPKPWSDLDLALTGGGPIPLALLAEMVEAFDESALPWKVDLVDRGTVSADFGAIIDANAVNLPL
jgi:predicted nucleotidyltransferase